MKAIYASISMDVVNFGPFYTLDFSDDHCSIESKLFLRNLLVNIRSDCDVRIFDVVWNAVSDIFTEISWLPSELIPVHAVF